MAIVAMFFSDLDHSALPIPKYGTKMKEFSCEGLKTEEQPKPRMP